MNKEQLRDKYLEIYLSRFGKIIPMSRIHDMVEKEVLFILMGIKAVD